jgi:hypothetical protein
LRYYTPPMIKVGPIKLKCDDTISIFYLRWWILCIL